MARRSARLSKTSPGQVEVNKPLPNPPKLDSVMERDESVEDSSAVPTIDSIINTPGMAANVKSQLKRLSPLNTPKTEPRPAKSEMDPKTMHQTMMPPDSGTKLGFADVSHIPRASVASIQNTPTRSSKKSTQAASAPGFKFTFASESGLSEEAKVMMENLREDAARIKAEMKNQKDLQDQKDGEAESMFSGRKIAKPKAKAGRFSDVHMAQFKKMDSIENHASSFRTRLGYNQPTMQSLKRSPSKAGLDEPERPRTAGKGTPGRAPPPFSHQTQAGGGLHKPASHSASVDRLENTAPAKRLRRSEVDDVSSSRPQEAAAVKPSGIPKSTSTSNLFSPTKASLARAQSTANSPAKPLMLPRSQSAKGVRNSGRMSLSRTTSAVSRFTSKLLEAQQTSRKDTPTLSRSKSTYELSTAPSNVQSVSSTTTRPTAHTSKLPTFSGLKSILRSPRKDGSTPAERDVTPKRPNTSAGVVESSKKVDFTPSVKSRYAVKLANNSPSPVKSAQTLTPRATRTPIVPYDPAAYVIQEDQDEAWEDASSSPIEYPTLPALSAQPSPRNGPVVQTLAQKAKDLGRRESKEFKSIFTTLHHPSRPSSAGSLTSSNATVGRADPTSQALQASRSTNDTSARSSRPSTIRRVRSSGTTEAVQPFEDTEVHTMAHGIPAKKRRRESRYFEASEDSAEASKENRPMAGAWTEGDDADDESARRAKRVKTIDFKDIEAGEQQTSPKKRSAAREAAAKHARDRKSVALGQVKGTPAKAALTMSRLNMLSQPKRRG
ncbi:uncharacterized protein HMPREF1541_09379 [Cyphellophora europaea CBS 101466]|uniref:Erythromycin esterase n=1 Tax=Cyphellophora europaea (strain CBS 101466) TaxID=1220924 RepID=W2SA28_CYPE1|nr:uncharacterized protein HMPREF1541_09379 [Cyphellophora europaea CBS 101466]ETN45547.1 hypothetical protein HMPREF1541_09379 [Cyphellophora europaea CBS 101466]